MFYSKTFGKETVMDICTFLYRPLQNNTFALWKERVDHSGEFFKFLFGFERWNCIFSLSPEDSSDTDRKTEQI